MTSPDLKTAALWYAQRLGWKIFPLHTIENGHCSADLEAAPIRANIPAQRTA